MIRSILAISFGIVGALVVVGFAGPADAQGTFDCRRPAESYQRVVCADANLRSADWRLNETLGEALRTVPNPDQLRSDQSEWTQNLRNCSTDALCLRDSYADRIGNVSRQTADFLEGQRAAEADKVEASEAVKTPKPVAPEQTPIATNAPFEQVAADPPLEFPADVSDDVAVPTDAWGGDTAQSFEPINPDTPPTAIPSESAAPDDANPMASIGLGLAMLALIVVVIVALLATRSLANYSMQRYGWPMILNWWNLLHLVAIFALIGGISFGAPIAGLVIAGGLWVIMLLVNCLKTNLLAGLAMTLIQPFVIFLLWALYGAARAKAEGRRV